MERNSSKKREAVFAALSASKEHPTAEMLYARMKQDYPELSLATVYRNLAVLIEDGRAVSLGEIDGKVRYDACVTPHSHFVCRCCGKIYDIEVSGFAPGDGPVGLTQDGFAIEGWEIRLRGLCPLCRGNE